MLNKMQIRISGFFIFSLLNLTSMAAFAAPDGGFRYPANNHTFNGNLLFSGAVEDPNGIGSLRLRFNGDASRQINICNNCGNSESFTDAGINPRDYNLNIGSHQAQLVVIKNGNESVIDSVSFSWRPPEITGIEVTRTFGSIAISWSGLSGYNLYNLYIASEADISPDNIDSLPDSITFRALRSTSQTISDVDDELGLFGLITGTDTSGESAYSQIFRIEALDNEDPTVVSENINVNEDSIVTGNVLNNDSDPEGQPLTAELNFSPNNGEVTLSENGDFSYQPAPDFNGSDSFTYVVSDPQGGSELGTVNITVRPVNDAPEANSDAYQLAEDTILSVSASNGVLANDTDIDGDALIAEISRSPENGSVSLNENGAFSYQPNSHFFGSDSFSYRIEDENGASDSATVSIVVSPVNDLPEANDDSYEVNEDNILAITDPTQGLLANDTDADLPGNERFTRLTATLLGSVNNGFVDLQSNGTFTFTPDTDFFGIATFSYQITDDEGATDTATVSIEVLSLPESPIAEDDNYTTNEDEPLVVNAAQGVLANDDNIAGNSVSVELLSGTLSGSLNLNSDGSFNYSPNENFNGSDSFSYQLTFAGGTSQASVNITILSVNDAPVVNDDTASTNENTPVTISPLENDSDPDGDSLSVIINSVSSGSAVVSAETEVIYTPETDFNGEVTINYSASDSLGGITEGTIFITVLPVNAPPVANDDLVQTNEDTPIVINPLDNDSDPNGDVLTLSIVSVSSGSAELASATSIAYTPEANFNGSVTLNYRITDPSEAFADGIIIIEVLPVNDAPEAQDDSFSIPERETLTFHPLENDSDIDSTSISIISATALSGEVTFTSDNITYVAPQQPGSDTISYTIADTEGEQASATISVTITDVDDAPVAVDDAVETQEDTPVTIQPLENDSDPDGDPLTLGIVSVTGGSAQISSDNTIEFTPDENFNGTANVIYSVTDPGGNSATANIAITITAVNDAPVALDDSFTIAERDTLVFNPLENDSDIDSTSLSIITASAVSGEVTFNNDSITYIAPQQPGTDTITYSIEDSEGAQANATIAVTITNVDDVPIAVDDLAETLEDTPVTLHPLENDTELDGDTLTLAIVSVTDGTAQLTSESSIDFTPAPDFNGVAVVTYSVTDPGENSANASIAITVTAVNDPPVAEDDSFAVSEEETITLNPLDNDVDVDGDQLIITSALAERGIINITETDITYTAPSTPGTDTISYTIADPDGESDSATINITINNIQDAPVAIDDIASTNEDTAVEIAPLNNDSDEDGDSLTVTINSVTNGLANVSNTNTILFTPESNFFGSANIIYTATDPAGNSDTATINIEVLAVNDAPIAVNDSATTLEDNSVTLNPLINDSDVEGDPLSYSVTSTSTGISVILSNNNLVYTPESNFNGTATIVYTLFDSSNASNTAEITINVTPVNDAPVATDDSVSLDQGTSISITPLTNDTDVDGDNLTIASATAQDGTVVIGAESKTLTYTASQNFSGADRITYTITDGTASDSGVITVTVNDVNSSPVANADSFAVFAGEISELDVLGNDTDADGDTLTITQASASIGTVSINSDASILSYTAPPDTTATDTVSYTISDPSGATASTTASISITVQALDGEFDSDGDGNSDVSASSDGNDYTVTFGDDVDAVYYEEDDSYVSVSANDEGVFELTIEGTSTSDKQRKHYGGIKSSTARDFVLPSTTNTVFYTIDGIEYSFTVSGVNNGNANVAFGPPQPLNTDFSGTDSHDFYLRQQSFTGPLRFGVENGEHYILNSDGTGMVRGADYNSNVSWQENNGALDIHFLETEEHTQLFNVYDLDDDDSDGIALNIITKAEADAFVAAHNDVFVNVYLTETRQVIHFLRDNRIFVDAAIELYFSYRIDSTEYPEITSADSGVTPPQASDIGPRQLWDIDSLKIQKLTYADLAASIATAIPRFNGTEFEGFVGDICHFDESSTTPGTGSAFCITSKQSINWSISNSVLTLDFGNNITAAYRWLDDLATEKTFSIELTVGTGSEQQNYSTHEYWLPLQDVSDTQTTTLMANQYFDSAFSKSNPEAREIDKSIKTSEVFGFYFDSSGLAKNIGSRHEFNGASLRDTDRRWEINNGDVSIFSASSLSSGNPFSYAYDQCTDNADASCFIWKVRMWIPVAISGNRLWVWETVIMNPEGPIFDGVVSYEEVISPRIQYYELNSQIPGAPDSVSFNQEPIWQIIDFSTEINTSINNIDTLNNFADPESDALTILAAEAEVGVLTINSDNSLNYVPDNDFVGNVNFYLEVSDGTNLVYPTGVIHVLTENIAPTALDDSATSHSGISELLTPLDNDVDDNNDFLIITSASSDVGDVFIEGNNTELEFTAPATFEGIATISYSISDGRGGSDTANISVSVSKPAFSGSYNFDGSNIDDFSISVDGSNFFVLFGEEVSAVYYEENGQTHIVSRNSEGLFEFAYHAGDTNIAQLYYVINGVSYSFSPDDLNLTTPNLVYYGEQELDNDFSDKTEFLLISRHPTHSSVLANGFENGILYDLQSSGSGSFSSPQHFDTVSWNITTDGLLRVQFDTPVTETIYYNVYDLDDEENNDAALGVITRAEADAYFAAYNDMFVPVNISTTAHELDAFHFQGYYYDVNITLEQTFQIDSSTYPEITSANSGVSVSYSGDYREMLDTSKFDFLFLSTQDIEGTHAVPVPIADGTGDFEHFASDMCTFTENSAGSNDGTGSCSITSQSFNWSIESDGSVSVDYGNSLTAVYRWLHHGEIENTLFVKAADTNSKIYATLDYWLTPNAPSTSELNSLINGNYLEIGDNLSNPFNFDQNDMLNDSIGNGFYLDNSGLAKSLSAFFDFDNEITIMDRDMQWQITGSGDIVINALSNYNSSDTFRYQYSQCTDSSDQDCYIWQTRTWIPIRLDGDRLWVLDFEERDQYQGFFYGPPTLEFSEYPRIRFYEPRTDIPGEPNSISFNQEPVFNDPGFITTEDTSAIFDILTNVNDPESDSVTLIDVRVNDGSIVINNDETVSYTPETSFTGTVSLKIEVSDGINVTEFYSYISVHGANNAPVANDDSENAVGSHTYSYQVLLNDTDADSDLLTITNISTTASGFSISSNNTEIEYNAPASLTATEIVTYTISDGNGGNDTATLTVNLVPNSAPIAVDDNLADITVGSATSLFPLSNDTDADGDVLVITAASSSSGSAVISGDGLSVSYTSTIAGANTINYTVSDNYGGSDTGVISLNANTAGNQAPVANDDSYVVTPSSVTNLTPLSNDTDANSDSLEITSSSANVGTSVISNGGTNIDYTAPSVAGSDSISYSISDGNGGSDNATINITINNAPNAVDDVFSGLEDQSHTLSPLTNDSDADGDSFVISSVSAASGTAIKLNDSQISYSNPTPGTDTITYQVTDALGLTDTATITFTVTHRPVAVNDSITINELALTSISPLDNDTDVESANSALIISSISGSAGSASIETGDRTISYTAPLQSVLTGSQDTITYTVEDEDGGTNTGTITINVNIVPVVQNDTDTVEQGATATLSPLSNDSDGDSDPLTIDNASAISGSVTITGSGSTLDYTAPSGSATTDTISYTVSDGNGGSASGTIAITVTNNTPVAVNDSYTLLSVSSIAATIDSSVGVLVNDTDPNADTLTVSLVTNPAYATTFNLNSDGSFSYEHNGSSNLTDSFVYQVSDGTYTAQGTASLTLKRANFTPDICTIPGTYTQAGESFSQTLKVMDLDEENQTFSVSGEPAWMTLNTVDGTTATLTGTPTVSDLGTTTITFNSTDGFDSDSVTFDLTVIDEFATNSNMDFDFGGTTEVVYDAVIDNFGNIVVVGTSDGNFAITRLLRDGSTDSTFNSGAVKIYDFGGANDKAISVKIRPDNGMVVAGQTDVAGTGNEDFAVIMLFADGSLDTSFSSDGAHTIDAGGFSNQDFLAEVLLHDNLDITLIGQSFESSIYKLTAVQLDKTGAIDSTFNSGSTKSIYGINDVNPEAAIEDGEGNIYIVGHGSNNTDSDIILTRISVADGSPNGFAGGDANVPLYYFNDGGNEYGYDLAFDVNGNVIIAGTKDNDFALYKFIVSWDNTNSEWDITQDSSFNASTGKNIIDLNGSSTDFAYSMIPDHRGNYYIAGKQGTNTSIIRISADGTLDTGYGTSGVKTINLSSGVSNTPAIIRTDAMGQLLIFDTEDAGSDAHISVSYDYILTPPAFGNCDYTGEYRSTSNKTQDKAIDISPSSDNKYFIAGWSLGQNDSNKDFVVIKTDDQGNFDTTFGEHGYARIDGGASTSITPYDVIGLGNKEAVIAGVKTGTDDLFLAKLNSSGELDSGFDSDGIRDFGGSVGLTPVQGLYNSSSNTFLIAGKDSSNIPKVYRFNANGTDDTSFGAGNNISTADAGVNYTAFNNANFSIYDMVRLNNGDIYLIGSYFDTYNKVALLKMDSAGLIDTGFGSSGVVTIDQGSAHAGFAAATNGTAIYILSKDTSTLAASVVKVGAAGSLDTSFDSDGLLNLSGYKVSSSSTSSVQVNSSGSIWVQVSKNGTTESMLKFTSTGVFDSSYINAGSTQFSHGVSNWSGIAGFALNASDEVMLFGTVNNDFSLATMSTNGEINNHENKILFDHGYGEHALSISLNAYSGPVLAGYGRSLTDYDDDMAIVKFDNSGNGDNSFGTYGQTANAIEMYSPNSASTQFHGFSISANGQFYATAESSQGVLPNDIYNARISPFNADLDILSYSINLTDILSSSEDLVGSQYLSDDGFLYLVGSTNNKALIYRYNQAGNVDSSFNSSLGSIELSSYPGSYLTAIAPTSDGKLVAVGYYSNGGDIDGLIVKFSPNGILDSSFSSDGIYEFQVASSDERFYDVAIDANGTIYAVGESNKDMLAVALDNNATLAESWNSTGVLTRDIESSSIDSATAVIVDAFGALFILVNSENEFTLLRYNPNGTLIGDFGGIRRYSPINKMRDIAVDSLGNVFVTGSTQLDQQWQFFTVRFPNAAGPY